MVGNKPAGSMGDNGNELRGRAETAVPRQHRPHVYLVNPSTTTARWTSTFPRPAAGRMGAIVDYLYGASS
ncbi:hypothetical protein DL770_000915 [Monosporascus sp. CRB-9-2]|nr:hypothetical protein DL770_000915 [Monosporascus sp. CRB-9-2]